MSAVRVGFKGRLPAWQRQLQGMLGAAALFVSLACAGQDARISVAASAVSASSNDGNVPANTVDGSLATRWSANGDDQWIQYDLGSAKSVGSVKIAWSLGDTRKATFDLLISSNGSTWTTVLASKQSSGTSAALESYDITDTLGRYVRIVGHGNTVNTWNSILETEVWGSTSVAATRINLATSAASASSNDGNVPGNTLDRNVSTTRWAALGDGQWIEYDLGSNRNVTDIMIAWYQGNLRRATFDVQMSTNRTTWVPLLTSKQSSGTTAGFERFDFADTVGRYLRIIGHGNTLSNWNSVLETEIYEVAGSTTSYTVSTTVSGSGTVSKSPNQSSYPANSTVVLSAAPAANFQFSGWSGSASGTTNPLSVTVNGNKNITATFIPVASGNFTLTTTTSGSGSITRTPNASSYASGTVVSLRATPATDFSFQGWSGAVTGTANPINVTMNANKSVVATFAPAGCQQVPSSLRTIFELEGPNPYSANGCTMVFEPLVAKFVTPNGNGWRHEVKIPEELRVGMTQSTESLRADFKVDLSNGGKTIITQYHAEGTGTIVKVYVSDTNESGFLNSIASDGIFDVYVRIRPAGSSSEEKMALGTIRTGESFNLAVSNVRGRVTVSAFGRSKVSNVDNGGDSYLKFGNYLQSQNPVGSEDCTPFATCYTRYGITVSKITMSNISYSRQ